MIESEIRTKLGNHLVCYNCGFELSHCPNCGAHIKNGESIVERLNQEIHNMKHFHSGNVLVIQLDGDKTIEIEINNLQSITIK
jgi:predicted RNA-binding Zn-ribbon protein involved in translation (DUF1610 family)